MRTLANGIGNYRRTRPVGVQFPRSAKLEALDAQRRAASRQIEAEMAEIVECYTTVWGNGFVTISRQGAPADFATVYVTCGEDVYGPWVNTAATVSPECRISAKAFAELVRARTTAKMERQAAAEIKARAAEGQVN